MKHYFSFFVFLTVMGCTPTQNIEEPEDTTVGQTDGDTEPGPDFECTIESMPSNNHITSPFGFENTYWLTSSIYPATVFPNDIDGPFYGTSGDLVMDQTTEASVYKFVDIQNVLISGSVYEGILYLKKNTAQETRVSIRQFGETPEPTTFVIIDWSDYSGDGIPNYSVGASGPGEHGVSVEEACYGWVRVRMRLTFAIAAGGDRLRFELGPATNGASKTGGVYASGASLAPVSF